MESADYEVVVIM